MRSIVLVVRLHMLAMRPAAPSAALAALLCVLMSVSCNAIEPPSDWAPRIASGNMKWTADDPASIGAGYYPVVGNGYVAKVGRPPCVSGACLPTPTLNIVATFEFQSLDVDAILLFVYITIVQERFWHAQQRRVSRVVRTVCIT